MYITAQITEINKLVNYHGFYHDGEKPANPASVQGDWDYQMQERK